MLKQVSWGEYLLVMCVLVAGYYLVTGLLYFSRDMKSGLQLVFGRKKYTGGLRRQGSRVYPEGNKTVKPGEDIPGNLNLKEAAGGPELVDLAYQLSTGVMEIISRAAECKYTRKELIRNLEVRLVPYHILAASEFRTAIDHLIKSQSERICSICLNEEEVNILWKCRADGAIV